VKALVVALSIALAASPAAAQSRIPRPPQPAPDVIYVPTPMPTVQAMLELAEVRPGDVLYDLGSGDGRIPIEAARRYGVCGVGVEISRRLVAEAQANARQAGVSHLVRFELGDLFRADYRDASVVTLYLLPELNARLMPKLLQDLPPGARIVSHAFPMGDWAPERELKMADGQSIYLWRVPTRPEGAH
jgi:cyclopropane fatty-acyl-phospholipid synthase-like methyltransferase